MYPVIALGALAGSVVIGTAGFAFTVVATAVWLHVLPPAQAVPLAVACAMLLNLALVSRLWNEIRPRLLWPFLVGGLLGVPLGVAALHAIDPAAMRRSVGWILIVYAGYMLTRRAAPKLQLHPRAARLLDVFVGAIGGFMSGAMSLTGIVPTLWCGLRGFDKGEQRGVMQPYLFVIQLATLLWFGGFGALSQQTLIDVLLLIPIMALGLVLGLKFFSNVSESGFRRLVLGLLLVSGAGLVI